MLRPRPTVMHMLYWTPGTGIQPFHFITRLTHVSGHLNGAPFTRSSVCALRPSGLLMIPCLYWLDAIVVPYISGGRHRHPLLLFKYLNSEAGNGSIIRILV